MLYEFLDELVLRGAYLAVNKAEGRASDQVKQAAKLNGNRPQSLAALVCTESFKERRGFG